MAITIRKALSTDDEFLAQALLESSRAGKKLGFFDFIFNTSDEKHLISYLKRLVVTSSKSYCHFSNFLIALENGKSVATICGYEPRIATADVFAHALEELGIDETYHERIAAYLLCTPDIDNKTWVCDFWMGHAGFGTIEIFKELVGKSILTARLKGYRKVQSMVEIGSIEIEMMYKKLGFHLMDEKRSEYYDEQFGRAGIMRLQMEL
jgi:hypothetical protein